MNEYSAQGKIVLYHIPVCPFCQRIDILLALKGLAGLVKIIPIDITKPRPDWLLSKTQGATAMPVLETEEGGIIKESLVILQYLESRFPEPPVTQHDPWLHAVEGMLITQAQDFVTTGYQYLMNQSREKSAGLYADLLNQYALLDAFLMQHQAEGTWLFDQFGLAEVIFTPVFQRFWFHEYYEGFVLPDEPRYARVRRWRDACVTHPSAQQIPREQIIKQYYDYAHGVGNGAVPPGRARSTMVFDPDWSMRPWPPKNKYGALASDTELGLI